MTQQQTDLRRPGGQVIAIAATIDTTRALSPDAVGRISEVCDRAEAADGTAVVVLRLTGSGDAEPWPGEVAIDLVGKWENALRRLERLAAVTIAYADGACGPSALELLLTADHRIAGERLRLDLRGGTWPGMAHFRLVKQIGLTRSRKLLRLTGPVGGELLVEFEVVDEITADLSARQAEIASRAATRRGADIALERQLLAEATSLEFEESLGTHLAAGDRLLRRQASAVVDG